VNNREIPALRAWLTDAVIVSTLPGFRPFEWTSTPNVTLRSRQSSFARQPDPDAGGAACTFLLSQFRTRRLPRHVRRNACRPTSASRPMRRVATEAADRFVARPLLPAPLVSPRFLVPRSARPSMTIEPYSRQDADEPCPGALRSMPEECPDA